jgi:preprotein translocase subunit SecE
VARNRRRDRERDPLAPAEADGVEANGHPDRDDVAPPLQHAAPGADLAEAQLALGRPDLADELTPAEAEALAQAEADAEADRMAVEVGTRHGAAVPGQPRPGLVERTRAFLQGSWRELQRVQWPDRRQVMQATGVVIGFVIIAGAYLGVADWAAQKVVTFILK